MFDGFDGISILSFSQAFQTVCTTKRIHESTAIWLFHFYRKKPAGAAINACTCLSSSSAPVKRVNSQKYYQVKNFLLATHAADNAIAEEDVNIINLPQPTSQNAVDYA